jgi:hypothetical protein
MSFIIGFLSHGHLWALLQTWIKPPLYVIKM